MKVYFRVFFSKLRKIKLTKGIILKKYHTKTTGTRTIFTIQKTTPVYNCSWKHVLINPLDYAKDDITFGVIVGKVNNKSMYTIFKTKVTKVAFS